jgi:molybdenum cofactor synthesis domain-containing protein
MNKTVKIEQAVGMILAHDITEIRKGEFKGRAFKKGHKIQEADLCHLQRLGKRRLYVLDVEEGYLHENDAATAMANAFCGSGVKCSDEPREGKIELVAARDGLLKVDVASLTRINLLGQVMCASRHTNSPVATGDVVAATRAIPLVVREELVTEAVRIAEAGTGVFHILPVRKARVGIVITGNEIFTRLVEDQFEAVLRKKIDRIGSSTTGVAFAPDDPDAIEKEVTRLIQEGADLILTTGGMSVDPDDVTRQGVERAGAEEFIYGASVLPGAMLMIAYLGDMPVIGVPACGLYHETTILDLVLPRILAGERLTRRDMAALGHGGLCLNCPECRFPICPFGKNAG